MPTAGPLPPGKPLLQQKYRELVRTHLGRLLNTLFAEFTGVHFHIAWTPAFPRQWDDQTLPTGGPRCCRLTGSARLPGCRTCGLRQLARTLRADADGHRFTCRLGVRNYWVPMRVRDEMLGIAYLQGLENAAAQPLAAKRLARAAQARPRRAGARVMNRLEFARAARFLRHIVQHVQGASLSDLRQEDLSKAQWALRVFENVQARLRKELNGLLPAVRKTPPVHQPESHCDRIVQALLERIHRDYAQPLTLRKCAGEFQVNAAYLSHLFSFAVGLPFKTCITEVRMEKARELLCNPAKNISQVASAVGYASPNRFRIAFKQTTSLSPRVWRETMRMKPPPTAQ